MSDTLPLVRPMLASPGALPPPEQEQRWAFEMKWDGVRAVVYHDRGDLRVLTRNDREVAATYPELAGLAHQLRDHRMILDGEVVAFDEAGRPSFGELQARMHVRAPGPALLDRVPVSLLVFDVLHVDGTSLVGAPYDERRAALEGLELAGDRWAVPPAFDGQGAEALAASKAQGLEGVLAKRHDSVYLPGRRSPHWIKVKHVRMQEVVVGGWSPGAGRRQGGIGSLLLGVPDQDGRLVYAGHVGTGFSDRVLADLGTRLRAAERSTSPFADEVPRAHAKDAHWVTPRLVGEVTFSEWTRDGRMRHPSWRGLRPDKDPQDVRRES
ncbi:MAG: bifunctional non-ous end joining protein LigD [Actinomycetota bacterium]|nr:bifunctional non-ous end joining protein LigD [Actinomycetota bacterium]